MTEWQAAERERERERDQEEDRWAEMSRHGDRKRERESLGDR